MSGKAVDKFRHLRERGSYDLGFLRMDGEIIHHRRIFRKKPGSVKLDSPAHLPDAFFRLFLKPDGVAAWRRGGGMVNIPEHRVGDIEDILQPIFFPKSFSDLRTLSPRDCLEAGQQKEMIEETVGQSPR